VVPKGINVRGRDAMQRIPEIQLQNVKILRDRMRIHDIEAS
jgi:hypothetical protein